MTETIMSTIDPIPGAGATPPVRRVQGGEACGSAASPRTRAFGGLLEDALRRLETLDEKLKPGAPAKGSVSVEKLESELRQADLAMRSAAEIREILLRAYQNRAQ
jgi:hypothetical protein